MAEKRQPWMKWYTRDWRGNAKLRICSYAARGLWADLLSLMWESSVCGFLMIDGIVPTARQLAGLLGGSEREVTKLRHELQEAGVFSVTGVDDLPSDIVGLIPKDMPPGVIFSRRMVRDVAKADRDRTNGKEGGNPKLRDRDNRGVNPKANPQRSEARSQKLEQGRDAAASSDAARAMGEIDEAFSYWSALASDLQIPDTGFLNGDRRALLYARLHEIGGLDGWMLALERVRNAEFFYDDGKPKRWLNLGWLLKPENFTGLMEGRYDQRHGSAKGQSALTAALAGLADEPAH